MPVISKRILIRTFGEDDIVDLTPRVREELSKTKISNGIVNIFVSGSTGALTTIEYEPGLVKDLPKALERVAPKHEYYAHEETWHDGNGHSHVRASIIGPSLTVPFIDSMLILGTWQQIVFVECDIRPRERSIILQFVGE